MNTEDLKKELEKLSRPDLNERAEKEHGIENASNYPNAPSLIQAIIGKESAPPAETKEENTEEAKETQENTEANSEEKSKEEAQENNEGKDDEDENQKKEEERAEKLLEERTADMKEAGMTEGVDDSDWQGFGLSINDDDLVAMDKDQYKIWLEQIEEAKLKEQESQEEESDEEETEEEQPELPTYTSTKKVKALKIATVVRDNKGFATITPDDENYKPFVVTPHYLRKFNPRGGGYYKVYEDGTPSYESAETFEAGYEKED